MSSEISSQDSIDNGSKTLNTDAEDQELTNSSSNNEVNKVSEPPNEPSLSNFSNSDQDISTDNTSENLEASNKVGLDNEARLLQLETEHETLRNQYVRIAADFDNFRKRQTRDQDDLKIQLTCNTLTEILPVVDNFERARQQLDPQTEEAQALHRSYQGLYKQLVEVLKQLGVAPMRVIGQQFDPMLHEAVLREPSDLQNEDFITEELQRGYHLNGKVLRHALVKVSMGPGPKNATNNNAFSKDSEDTSLEEKDDDKKQD